MPRYRLKDIEPVKMWAAISEDVPPQIWDLGHYRENIRDDLRHIRVMVTPIIRKPARKRRPQ